MVRRWMRACSRACNLYHRSTEVFGWKWNRAQSFPQQKVGCSGLPLYLRGLYEPKFFYNSHITLCLLCSSSCKGKYEEAQFSSKLLHKENNPFLPRSLDWTEKYLTWWLLQIEVWGQGPNLWDWSFCYCLSRVGFCFCAWTRFWTNQRWLHLLATVLFIEILIVWWPEKKLESKKEKW